MDRDKQIEEIAYDVCNNSHCTVEEWQCCSVCAGLCEKAKSISEKLIDKGYRKASEVAREIFEEIETSLMIESFHGGEVYYAIRAEDYLHYKKKYIGEDINVTTKTEDN